MPELAPQPLRFGRYALVERLGQGGMAEVWKARLSQADGDRTLVIKRILPQLARDKDLVAMFMREAKLCSMLRHPNIVRLYELGEIAELGGEPYLAMEYVHGRDLHALVNSAPRTPPPPGLAALIGRDVCRALAYAHSVPGADGRPLRVIHRDVTPANVMLTLDGAVKLVDFGVAKALSSVSGTITNVAGIRGKLGYSAPEQLLSGDVDHRTDLFAAGIVVHELLTGRRLFAGDDDRDTIDRVLEGPIHPPSRINAAIPSALDPIVLRALERDPEKRFQNGDEMADAFDPVVRELGWDAENVAKLVLERFPSLEQRTSTRPSQQRAAELGLRPTASFVTIAEDMGGWTSHTTGPQPRIDVEAPAKSRTPIYVALLLAAIALGVALYLR